MQKFWGLNFSPPWENKPRALAQADSATASTASGGELDASRRGGSAASLEADPEAYRKLSRQLHKLQSRQLRRAAAQQLRAKREGVYAAERLRLAADGAEELEHHLQSLDAGEQPDPGQAPATEEDHKQRAARLAKLAEQWAAESAELRKELEEIRTSRAHAVNELRTALVSCPTDIGSGKLNSAAAAAVVALPALLWSCADALGGSGTELMEDAWANEEATLLATVAPLVSEALPEVLTPGAADAAAARAAEGGGAQVGDLLREKDEVRDQEDRDMEALFSHLEAIGRRFEEDGALLPRVPSGTAVQGQLPTWDQRGGANTPASASSGSLSATRPIGSGAVGGRSPPPGNGAGHVGAEDSRPSQGRWLLSQRSLQQPFEESKAAAPAAAPPAAAPGTRRQQIEAEVQRLTDENRDLEVELQSRRLATDQAARAALGNWRAALEEELAECYSALAERLLHLQGVAALRRQCEAVEAEVAKLHGLSWAGPPASA